MIPADDIAPNWLDDAVCATVDPDLFYTGETGGNYFAARRICDTCPITGECLQLALDNEAGTSARLRYGMFGGKTPAQRAKMDPTVQNLQDRFAA